jgi:hypothetical protein
MEKRTSAAKAGYSSVIYGTAEPAPFQDRVLSADYLAPGILSGHVPGVRGRSPTATLNTPSYT